MIGKLYTSLVVAHGEIGLFISVHLENFLYGLDRNNTNVYC